MQARWRGVHSPHPPVVEAASRASSPALVCSESRSTASLHLALSQSYSYVAHCQILHVTCMRIHLFEHCRQDVMYVPLRRDKRKDTNRHMMCWVRILFVQAKYTDQDMVNHQSYQPTKSGGREPTTTGTTCSPCGCREAWWKSKLSKRKEDNWLQIIVRLMLFRLIEIERGYQSIGERLLCLEIWQR